MSNKYTKEDLIKIIEETKINILSNDVMDFTVSERLLIEEYTRLLISNIEYL